MNDSKRQNHWNRICYQTFQKFSTGWWSELGKWLPCLPYIAPTGVGQESMYGSKSGERVSSSLIFKGWVSHFIDRFRGRPVGYRWQNTGLCHRMNYPAASSGVSGVELPISLTPQAAGNSTLVGLKGVTSFSFHSQQLLTLHRVVANAKLSRAYKASVLSDGVDDVSGQAMPQIE